MAGSTVLLSVTIDRALGFVTDVAVRSGATFLHVKEQMAAGDPTGGTNVEEFSLAYSPFAPGQEVVPLPDSTVITGEHRDLDLCHQPPPRGPPPGVQSVVRGSEWQVVGGADKGGIMVRDGRDLKSEQCQERLATGSVVLELELAGDRLHYKLASGTGPTEGWVSIKLGSKTLVEPLGGGPAREEEAPDTWQAPSSRDASARQILASIGRPYEVLGLEPGAPSSSTRRAYHCLALLHHPDKGGDEVVFKAVADAYKSLTEAKDETGGWRDLDGQAVGPWPGHAASTKGVTCMLFDCFGAPPWESRRMYTGSWQESSVRCWELSKGEPGKVRPPPRLVGEIQVGGFVNDIAAISPFGMLTAQSAGMKPLPGESLRAWDLKKTPFKAQKRGKVNAIKDGEAPDAGGGAAGESALALAGAKGAELALQEDEEEQLSEHEANTDEISIPVSGMLDDMSQMVYLHHRGVRCISLWPRPENKDATPHLAATVSKDIIAVSKIGLNGCSLDTPAVWKKSNPHAMSDVNSLRHEDINRMWSGDNKGVVKCWDVSRDPAQSEVFEIPTPSGWMTGMEVWPTAGVLACSHSNGLLFVDTRAGKIIRQQTTKNPVGKISTLNGEHPILFAGVGNELMQYDTRCFRDGIDQKPKAVGQWTLSSAVTALHCTETRKGHLLVGVGCLDGKVAAFDTT